MDGQEGPGPPLTWGTRLVLGVGVGWKSEAQGLANCAFLQLLLPRVCGAVQPDVKGGAL